ncbi:hypothetical protein [Leptolyngbya sp. PCC 6406]|uniref:hypothetical protein n=1 Tax=Leptolyngbya sp. PCC 6406 TaxID=1173264 RepID=UPI0002AC5FBA|nr:hypothetical protein [Leptolyngbya sp. PCC 6406]
MITETLTTELSTEVLTFHPDGPPAQFEVLVHNTSASFASFQLDLSAAGADTQTAHTWYRVAPAVSSKIPSGARTRFQIELLAMPPVPVGFSGTMNLTVRVSSLELRDEDRQILRLVVEGNSRIPPRLVLPVSSFQVYPEKNLEIPVQVHNLNRQAVDIHLALAGLPRLWLPEGDEKPLHLQSGQTLDVRFFCQLPAPTAAPSRRYPLTVTATQANTLPVIAQASLEVLPQGYLIMACEPQQQRLPQRRGWFYNSPLAQTTFAVQFTNEGNVAQSVEASAHYTLPQLQRRFGGTAIDPVATESNGAMPPLGQSSTIALEEQAPETRRDLQPLPSPPLDVAIDAPVEDWDHSPRRRPYLQITPPERLVEVGETATLDLEVVHPLPWLGWPRRRQLKVEGYTSGSDLHLRQEQEFLDIQVLPVIPFWLQLAAAGMGILLTLWLWWAFLHRGHRGVVNAVQFSGQGHELISAGDDQALLRWGIFGRVEWRSRTWRRDKALRVAAYRPNNNNQIWVGFENGQIEGWDLLSKRVYTLNYAQDDRVFDLALPAAGQTLFSAHGSGLVLEWNITPGQIPLSQTQPQRGFETGFAVQALAMAGAAEQHLVAAGRFNRLVLLDLETETFQPLDYPPGDGNQYIWDVATAAEKPTLLAVADSQGRLSLWDLAPCLPGNFPGGGNQPCRLLDDWGTGHEGLPVRSIALSADGCYLVSGGEDGHVVMWPLNSEGRRRPGAQEGVRWHRGRGAATSVDIQQQARRLLVAYGTESGAVNLEARPIPASTLPPGECAVGR